MGKFFFSSQFSLFDKYLTVSWHFSMLMGSSVYSTSSPSTGSGALESVRLKVPVVFFSRPLSFPVTQSYLISWTATREEDPGVRMLIRAVGRHLDGLEEPERRQETRSNTVTENLLQQAGRHEGDKMWNFIWRDFEVCQMSRVILIKEENYELYLLHTNQYYNFNFTF